MTAIAFLILLVVMSMMREPDKKIPTGEQLDLPMWGALEEEGEELQR